MSDNNVVAIPPAPKKYRTVTMTNHRPVSFVEAEWPIVAEGKIEYDPDQEHYPISWSVEFYVRMHKYGRHLVYGKYLYHDDMREHYQTIRVGRLLDLADEEEKVLVEVGEEMRSRVTDEHMKWHITEALDRCFASMGPQLV